MSGFDKEFGNFTLRKLKSRDFCKFDKKEKCRNIVSIYSGKCKECFVASGDSPRKDEEKEK